MKKESIAISLIFILLAVAFSGCTQQTGSTVDKDSEFTMKTGKSTEKIVGLPGGDFYFLDNSVILEVPENGIGDETTITVSELISYPSGPDVTVLNAYEFEPDGITFTTPVTIRIFCKTSVLPDNVDEEDLGLFIYQNGKWDMITDSGLIGNYIVGTVTHFCSIGGGCFTDYEDLEESDERNEDEEENNSASITFEVPIVIVDYIDYISIDVDRFPEEVGKHDHQASFLSRALAIWDPQPYVRYYEVSLNFNGNPPKDGDRIPVCGCFSKYPYVESETYYIGNDPSIIDIHNHKGTYDNHEKDLHEIIGDVHYTGWGILQEEGIPIDPNVEKEMSTFMHDYFEGWTLTVRAVS